MSGWELAAYAVVGLITGLAVRDEDGERTVGSVLGLAVVWPLVWTIVLLKLVLGIRL